MSTLSGNTIASSYPSLLRLDNFTGLSINYNEVVDGLGRPIPLELSTGKIKFKDRIDFKDTTSVDFSGTSLDYRSAGFNLDNAVMDFRNVFTQGLVKDAAVQKSTGRLSGLTDSISYSGGTGIEIDQDDITGIFTFTNTGSDKQIVYKGISGITTTPGKVVYWSGGNWNNGATSSNAYNKLVGIAIGTDSLVDGVIISGLVDDSANTGYTEGALYLSSTAGALSSIPDYTSGGSQRGIGHSLGSLGVVLNPDIYYVLNNGNTSFIETNDDEVLITNDGFAISYE